VTGEEPKHDSYTEAQEKKEKGQIRRMSKALERGREPRQMRTERRIPPEKGPELESEDIHQKRRTHRNRQSGDPGKEDKVPGAVEREKTMTK